jgi:hypothetical protein
VSTAKPITLRKHQRVRGRAGDVYKRGQVIAVGLTAVEIEWDGSFETSWHEVPVDWIEEIQP